ncbi:MAG: hypothetical protein Ct9H300mP9_5470 [Candidatus Neomarinimicrobiota bacterium]|nr:MAG: hypothetical protein Ct9H300mP9_5470 [Candidatus Neomarinimicrobiota bacterium]
MSHIDKLTDHIKQQNETVTSTYSITDIIKKMHFAFNNGNYDSLKIPEDRELITQYMFLYSLTGDDDDFNLILDDPDEPSYTQVFIRIGEVHTEELMALVDDTEDYVHAHYYDDRPIKPMLSGPAALLGAVSHLVVRGQIISLAYASIIFFCNNVVRVSLIGWRNSGNIAYVSFCFNDFWSFRKFWYPS